MSDHTLDGYNIELGDGVYDVLFGQGRVTELLSDGRFRVAFSHKNSLMTYEGSGVSARYTRRTLFWHDPVIMYPPKGDVRWGQLRPILISIVNTLRGAL